MENPILIKVVIAVALLGCVVIFSRHFLRPADRSVSIVSYNIRIGSANDGDNSWELRAPASVEMTLDQRPDVIGFQEALEYQVKFMADGCEGYKLIGEGHDRGAIKCEHMSMLYNSETTDLVDWGTFWLSDTPEVASMGWDAAYERSATWALLFDKPSKRQYIVVNTHLDNEGPVARQKGLELILERLTVINPTGDIPVALMGDFNMEYDDRAMASVTSVMKDARLTAELTDTNSSYNGWGSQSATIDYIFWSGFKGCERFETIQKPYLGRELISDHYPVKAVLKL